MKKLLLTLLCLIGLGLSASAKETSYTIEFVSGTGVSNGTSVSTRSDIIKTGQYYVASATAKQLYVTNSDYGVRISSNKNAGSCTLTLSDDGKVVPTKMVVNTAVADANGALTVNGKSLTYSNTAKPSGAPNFEEITVTGISTTETLSKIEFTGTGGKRVWIKSVTVYYDDGLGGADPEPGVAADYKPVFEPVSLTVGATHDISVKSDNATDNAPALTYTVAEGADVISIAGNTITALAAGTAKVNVAWSEVAETWTAGSATFDVSFTSGETPVEPEPDGDVVYQLVKSTDDLVAGDKYVIAHHTQSVSQTMSNAPLVSNKAASVDVTIADGFLAPAETTLVFELGGAAGAWTMKTVNYQGGADGYLKYSNGSKTDISYATAATEYTITVSASGNFKMTPAAKGSGTVRYIGYNLDKFGAYASSYTTGIQLYRRIVVKHEVEDYAPVFDKVQLTVGGTQSIAVKSDNASALKPAPAISYAVDGETDVIALDGAGVKAVKVGTATVKASWDAVEGKWRAGSADIDVAVAAAVYQPKFDAIALAVGDAAALAVASDNATADMPAPAVTYSAESDVVTVADGKVTAVKAGEATVKVSWAAGDIWAAGEAEIAVTVSRKQATLAWSADKVSVKIGEQLEQPVLTVEPADAAAGVQYASSNEAVATIDATGTVTVKAYGTTQITATMVSDIYEAEPATYKLSVLDPSQMEVTFDFSVKDPYDGLTSTGGGNQLRDELTVYENGIGITLSDGYKSHNDGSYTLRVYKGGKLKVSAPAGYELAGVSFVTVSGSEASVPAVDCGEVSGNINWTISAPDWTEEVTFTMDAKLFASGVIVKLRELPEAAEPGLEYTWVGNIITVNFTAVHPSHTLYYRTRPRAAAAMRAPAADTEGWTATEAPLHLHSHEIDLTSDYEPYIIEAKAVDRQGRESVAVPFEVRTPGEFTGIEDVAADAADAEYFDLRGVRLPAAPARGIYLRRQAGKVTRHIAR